MTELVTEVVLAGEHLYLNGREFPYHIGSEGPTLEGGTFEPSILRVPILLDFEVAMRSKGRIPALKDTPIYCGLVAKRMEGGRVG